MVYTGTEIASDTTIAADAVVVGSGAGGATAAHLLAQAGRDVVVVEEGGCYSAKDFSGRVSELMGKLYRDKGLTPVFGKPNIPFIEGCCLGGSTVINGGLAWRTPEWVLERWATEFELPDLLPEHMDGIFDTLFRDLNITVQDVEGTNRDSHMLIEGCNALGWKYAPVPRAQINCQNINRCPTGCPTGAKQDMLVTYLDRAEKNGARIYCDSRVHKILFDGSRALGIEAEVRSNGATRKLTVAAPNVFLAGGPMQTPYLLLRNGIAAGVGSNLQIHLNVKVVAVFAEDMNPRSGTMMTAQVKEFSQEHIYMGASNFDPAYLAVTLAPHGMEVGDRVMQQWRNCGIYLAQIKCSGTGRVVDRHLGRPLATYDLVDEDVRKITFGIEKLAELLMAAGAVELYLPLPGSPVIRSMEDMHRFLAVPLDTASMDILTVHAVGTCAMGPDQSISATGPYGAVRGRENLYVCDAGMLPESPGLNPQITIQALAHRNINHFLNSGVSGR